MNKVCKKVLRYIINCYNSGHNPTFAEISNKFDIQCQDLQIIFDYLIENNYYMIANDKNTNINWNKYNGVPTIQGLDYFKDSNKLYIQNFFKYVFFNMLVPVVLSIIVSFITTKISNDECCNNRNNSTGDITQNLP